jgi:hypothetical protein
VKRFLLIFVLMLLPVAAFAADTDLDKITNMNYFYVSGNNDTVGTTLEPVGDTSAAVNWLSTASTLEITSENAADAAGGTGAVTVVVDGLDADWNLQSETVTMNGTAGVVTTKYFLRVNKLTVATCGTSGTNVGVIYAFTGADTAGIPDATTTIYGMILVGKGQSMSAIYSVPAGNTALIKHLGFSGVGSVAKYELTARENLGPWRTITSVSTIYGGYETLNDFPIVLRAKTDFVINAKSASASALTANFVIRLLK